MAEVIKLDERRGKAPTRPSIPHEAKILLFTGVRYERWKDAGDGPFKRTGNAAKRKKH